MLQRSRPCNLRPLQESDPGLVHYLTRTADQPHDSPNFAVSVHHVNGRRNRRNTYVRAISDGFNKYVTLLSVVIVHEASLNVQKRTRVSSREKETLRKLREGTFDGGRYGRRTSQTPNNDRNSNRVFRRF